MFEQRDALIRLLRDDDPATVSLVKEQLTTGGPAVLGDLRDLLGTDDERVSKHVTEMIREIEGQVAQEDFAAFCRHFPDHGDIEEASWMLARTMIPNFDPKTYRAKLDSWGRQLTILLQSAVSDRERVEILSRFLSEHLSFRGNSDDYYNPRNSFLPTVIDARSGIPITLCVVYMLVAARAGMAVEGVNLPGHFILRHREVFFDPFHQGKILSLADCREILDRQNLEIDPSHFATATSHQILVRGLANLLFIYERLNDSEMQSRILSWLAALDRKPGRKFSGDE
ncbi:MAG TPA: transglutaminase-like domain-containing protein [Chthoniobacterales bacterium]|jgi:regulator of sirC expression with transglutaminase-like and TPR domain